MNDNIDLLKEADLLTDRAEQEKNQATRDRLFENGDALSPSDPIKIEANSAKEAAERASGSVMVELSAEDEHAAVAVVSADDPEHEASPRYFGTRARGAVS